MEQIKQTAVEWLGLYIKGITSLNCDEIIEKAKAMEKQQIIDAYDRAKFYDYLIGYGKKYYNETFKK